MLLLIVELHFVRFIVLMFIYFVCGILFLPLLVCGSFAFCGVGLLFVFVFVLVCFVWLTCVWC